jgi:hypothetical protein
MGGASGSHVFIIVPWLRNIASGVAPFIYRGPGDGESGKGASGSRWLNLARWLLILAP